MLTDRERLGWWFLESTRLEKKEASDGLTAEELRRSNSLMQRIEQHLEPEGNEGHPRRRRSKRVATRLRCEFESMRNFEKAVITNFSCGGVFIETSSPLPIGTKLSIVISIEEIGDGIELSGEVVSQNFRPGTAGEQNGMGIRFLGSSRKIGDSVRRLYALSYDQDPESECP